PDIVHSSLNAYGHDGPWSERAGWEQLAQAVSGMQVRRGGRDGAPITLPYPMNDYGTGLLGAYAVSLALHERNKTGRGQSVDCGLALTALAAVLDFTDLFLDNSQDPSCIFRSAAWRISPFKRCNSFQSVFAPPVR
ncbi:MAG: CoA transferase, partial [Proteobacteria bacterium]|nr:CoA transferase [Pseudomonadota bacterium]